MFFPVHDGIGADIGFIFSQCLARQVIEAQRKPQRVPHDFHDVKMREAFKSGGRILFECRHVKPDGIEADDPLGAGKIFPHIGKFMLPKTVHRSLNFVLKIIDRPHIDGYDGNSKSAGVVAYNFAKELLRFAVENDFCNHSLEYNSTMKPSRDTSWHTVGKWNNTYFEDHLIGPGVLRLLGLKVGDSLLDLACGTGWLQRKIPKGVRYMGYDIVRGVDVTKPLPTADTFSHATIILALQNIEFPALVIKNAADHVKKNGTLVIVLNHPAFRIPRQSSWGIDEHSKIQYRRENIYMSPLKIPITMHPGQSSGPLTWSFHQPLSAYTKMLADNHFVIENIEEWTSDKESVGSAGKMENRSRAEFPLFLALLCRLDT